MSSPWWGKVSPGGICHYPSHLYLSGVRRGSDADAEGADGYKRVAGMRRRVDKLGRRMLERTIRKGGLRTGELMRILEVPGSPHGHLRRLPQGLLERGQIADAAPVPDPRWPGD